MPGPNLTHFWRFHVVSLKRFRHILALLILSLSPSLFGQAVSGSVLGTVQDTSGAAVAKASITAVETNTGTTYESVSNDAGNYSLASTTAAAVEFFRLQT